MTPGQKEIYLDNSATTPVLPEIAEVMVSVLTAAYGNPSSLHKKGLEAEKILSGARKKVADCLGVRQQEIIFTSGGTEANNLAIKGAAYRGRRRKRHVITGSTEHPSVLSTVSHLGQEGFEVTLLPVDREGKISLAQLAEAIREDTVLVSIMHVNNETGVIAPVAEIGALVKEKNPEVLFHVDAVQSFGKLPVEPRAWRADLVTMSAHKIHGPKGTGALYCREGVQLAPLLHGGGQERELRPGTENMAGIAGFAAATELACRNMEKNAAHLGLLREKLLEGLRERVPDVVINSPPDAAPHIVNITVPGLKGEVLVHALAEHGIFVSTGSACHSRRPEPSHVLLAMGRTRKEVEASLRISFSPKNGEDEIDFMLEVLEAAVRDLRLLTGRR